VRAAVQSAFGGPAVVRVTDVPDPVVGDADVLVEVRAFGVASGDVRVRAARFPRGFGILGRLALGLRRPRHPILGTTAAGVITRVGDAAAPWRVGERVLVSRGAAFGCHAERLVVRSSGAIARLPDELDFTTAAALPFGPGTALHFLERGARLAAGERVLVNGASGAVGSAAVLFARATGAHVTAACRAANADWVRALGAHEVVVRETLGDLGVFEPLLASIDVALDTTGDLDFAGLAARLAPNGRLALVAADLPTILAALVRPRRGGRRVIVGVAPEGRDALERIVDLWSSGVIVPPLERVFPFDEIAAAHAFVESGTKRGNVVVCVRERAR
jgi:NADPH:quinone reductase-like Zn-dependent oxidoreductase